MVVKGYVAFHACSCAAKAAGSDKVNLHDDLLMARRRAHNRVRTTERRCRLKRKDEDSNKRYHAVYLYRPSLQTNPRIQARQLIIRLQNFDKPLLPQNRSE